MAGEEAISYTDMDIEESINDFCNRFIDEISLTKTITYATKKLGFEKVIEQQRNCALVIKIKTCCTTTSLTTRLRRHFEFEG